MFAFKSIMPKRGKSYIGKLPKVNPKTISGKCASCKKIVKNLTAHKQRMHLVEKKPKA